MGRWSGGDLLIETQVLFDCGDVDFKLKAFVDFSLLELGQLGVEAMSSLVAISLRRSAMSSLVAIRLTTKSSISPSSLSVVFFGAICGEYSISVVGGTSAPIVGMSRSMKIGKRERGFWKRGSV
jgi:hypothetical protein